MTHDKFCRFANDDRRKDFKGACFDCQRLAKARKEERELVAQEIENLQNPPPVDEIETIVWDVIEKCAEIARRSKE